MTTELQNTLDALAARLAAVEAKVGVAPPAAGAAPAAATAEVVAPAVKAYDAYCREYLDPFVAACLALDAPEAAECGQVVKEGWAAMRAFIVMASKCKKPAAFPADVMPFLQDAQGAMQRSNKSISRGDWECHQKTVAEGLQCLGWLVVAPAPRDLIENYVGGQDFWANKIRVKFRKTDPKQIAFCDTFKKLVVELMPYVKEHHMTGVTFNFKGIDIKDYKTSDAAAPVAPPPAPVAAAPVSSSPSASSSAVKPAGGLADLKAALSSGGGVTAGLKKVTKDMQTWRAEYKGGEAPNKPAAPAMKKPAPRKQTVTKGPPVHEFQQRGLKWLVENQTKENGVVTVTMDPKDGPKHTVYICACYEATIDIKGKCKGVAVDSCAKSNVLFDSAISSLEVVNSKSMKLQSRGEVPSVAIDKTDSVCVYLTKDAVDKDITTFVTSKSSDMQISFPDANGDMVECPIPEQFVHKPKFNHAGKPTVTSDVSDLYSH